jgi:FCD domain-containing protein
VFVASAAERMRSGPMLMGFEWARARVADYHEVRSALEPIIYHHAARHRTEADIRALRSILASMSAHLDEPRAYARYGAAFHRRIAKLTPNVPLRSMYVTLLDFFENDAAAGDPPGAVHPGDVDVHRQLVDAIERGDAPGLEAAIRRHDSHRLTPGALVPARRPRIPWSETRGAGFPARLIPPRRGRGELVAARSASPGQEEKPDAPYQRYPGPGLRTPAGARGAAG